MILRLMLKEEYRLHSTYSSKRLFLAFPAMVILLSAMTSLTLQALEEEVPIGQMVVFTHASVLLYGVSVGAFGFLGRNAVERSQGKVNFLVAMPFYHELVGRDHPGLKMAWVFDAFGNGPGHPQVLKGVGAEAGCATTYRFCPEDVWVGIDGTKVLCYDNYPAVRKGQFEKHPPCDHCAGKGCDACDGSGLDFGPMRNAPR